jgi:hypothetical protein
MTKIIPATLSLIVWFAGAQTTPNASAQAPVSSTSSGVVLPELQLRGPAPTTFATLVKEAGLSGGVAGSNQGCSRPPVRSVSVPAGTTFENAVALVAKLGSRSKWTVQGSVVVFLPNGVVPPLLRVQIQSLTWDKTLPLREVLDRIRQLPEVTEAASKLGLAEAPFEGGASTICLRGNCGEDAQPQMVVETEESVPLLTLLNRVAQVHKAVWDYSELRCEKGTLFSLGVLPE